MGTSFQEKIDQIKACTHCGICLSSCPTYLVTGNEANSPRGRLYLIKDAIKEQNDQDYEMIEYLDNCLSCGACETSCPSDVEYLSILEYARDEYLMNDYSSGFWGWLRRNVFNYFLPSRNMLNLLSFIYGGIDYIYQQFPKLPKIHDVQPDNEFKYRPIRVGRTYKSRIEENELEDPKMSDDARTLTLPLGCVADTMYNRTHHATIKVLNAVGYHVYIPYSNCCGALSYHSGEFDRGMEQLDDTIRKLETAEFPVVTNSAGCGSFIKNHSEIQVNDFIEALFKAPIGIEKIVERINDKKTKFTITYQPACHLTHTQTLSKTYEDLFALCSNIDAKPLHEADICCGSAGFYNLINPGMAREIGKRKAENVKNSEAKIVLAANQGCIGQIKAYLDADYKVMHPSFFLEKILISK